MKTVAKTLLVLLILGAAAGAGTWYLRRNEATTNNFRTTTIRRGDLLATISATGTIEPEEVIDVGAQVAGQINSFGKDESGKPIDYGSVVAEGMILAQIDDSLYAADAAQAQAQLAQAKAGVLRAEADLVQFQAKYDQAQHDWERAQQAGKATLSQESLDAYRAAYESTKANVAVGRAAIEQANGAVTAADASVKRTSRNLSYCTIKAPVDGVIIDRRVNIGQTVVASLNAPSLFLIAKDLKRMQVWVSVNEADIGNIHAGQKATFTVDAFPNETFSGEVGKVRLNATMTQNVVTYTVEVTTDNSNGKLLPYLTANVQFEVARHDNVLMAPNAALRWTPQPNQIAPDAVNQTANGPTTRSRSASGPNRQSSESNSTRGTLWALDGNFVRPVRVRLGLSDGASTEILSDQIEDGATIVVGDNNPTPAAAASGQAVNPFAPTFPRGGGGRRGGG